MQCCDRIRVLLVDDHPVMLEGIRASLKSWWQLEVVGEAANGREALERAQVLSPDVIVMDINMPVMDGIAATHQLLRIIPDAKVLILTLHEREFMEEIIQAGARGYLSKNAPQAELVRAIEAVHRGNTFFQFPPPLPTSPNTLGRSETDSTLHGFALRHSHADILQHAAVAVGNRRQNHA